MAGLLPPGPEVSWRRGRPLNRVVSGEDLRSGASPVEPLRGDSHSRGLRINTSARAGILPDIWNGSREDEGDEDGERRGIVFGVWLIPELPPTNYKDSPSIPAWYWFILSLICAPVPFRTLENVRDHHEGLFHSNFIIVLAVWKLNVWSNILLCTWT